MKDQTMTDKPPQDDAEPARAKTRKKPAARPQRDAPKGERRDARDARGERPQRRQRDERPKWEERGERPSRFSRPQYGEQRERGERGKKYERPARFERGDRGDRGDRFERPQRPPRFDRDERGERGGRFGRPRHDDRPSRFSRPPYGERGERDERKERYERPSRGDRFERPQRPPRFERDERGERGGRFGRPHDDRPSRFSRPPYGERGERGERHERPQYPSRFSRERPQRPDRFARPSQDERGDRGGERPARFDRYERGERAPRAPRYERPDRFARYERPPRPPAKKAGPPPRRKPRQHEEPGATVKAHKVLAQHGYGSRRLMEEWITQGRVEINGKKAEIGARVGKGDALLVDGKPVGKRGAPARLLMYHKPPGKIVERKEGGNTVFDDLPPLAVGKWHNIGRLDVATEGLLLFTTDGDFVEKMAHPSFGIEREYRARANGVLSAQTLSQICRDGVALGETSHARPLLFEREEQPAEKTEAKAEAEAEAKTEAEAANGNGNDETPPPPMTAESAQDWQSMEAEEGAPAQQSPCWYRVIVNEGRNRLVRRLFETQGLSVSCLLRVRFGEYRLPPDLPSGNWKELPPPK